MERLAAPGISPASGKPEADVRDRLPSHCTAAFYKYSHNFLDHSSISDYHIYNLLKGGAKNEIMTAKQVNLLLFSLFMRLSIPG